MQTEREFTVFEVRRLDKGFVAWQLVSMGQVWWTLEKAREYVRLNPHPRYRLLILRKPPVECAELMRWLCTPLHYLKAGSKKSYLVIAPMPGKEEGTYWLAGCYGTIKEAKAHAGHYGKLISVIHPADEKRTALFDQPAPISQDLWGLA